MSTRHRKGDNDGQRNRNSCTFVNSGRIKKVQLEKMKTPGGPRLLTSDLNSIATEIIKLLMLHKFSTTDLGIVCSLVIYRVTGQWVVVKLESRIG